MDTTWPLGRRLVVSGYALSVLGAVLYFIMQVRAGWFHNGVPLRFDVESLASLLATGASFLGWWWLSALEPQGAQRVVMSRGFVALAAQLALFALLDVLSLSSVGPIDALARWNWWLHAIGELAAALGPVLLAIAAPAAPPAVAATGAEDRPEEMDDPEVDEEESEGAAGAAP